MPNLNAQFMDELRIDQSELIGTNTAVEGTVPMAHQVSARAPSARKTMRFGP